MINSRIFLERGFRRHWLCGAAVAALLVYSAAQLYAVDANRTVAQYLHDSWGMERGFPGGSVRAMAQTPDGYLWIGTDKGLIRFDGLNFRSFPKTVPGGNPIGTVQAMQVDSEGNLWVLLQSTNILRYRGRRFEEGHDQAEFGITALGRRNTGGILLSSLAYGTLIYDSGKFEVLRSTPPQSADSPGAMTTETKDTLSSRFSWATGVLSHRLAEPNSPVTSMVESPDGKVWLGTTDNGLFLEVDGRVSAVASGILTHKIACLLPLENSRLWIGTDDGILMWNGAEVTAAAVPSALQHGKILAMIRDRDSNIWVGTARGLLRVNSSGVSPSLEQTATSEPVTALLEDREGNLWAGGPRGIERFRDGTFVTYSTGGLESESSGPVYVDGEGRTWFAPFEGGLHWLKNGEKGIVRNDGLDKDVVYSIAGGGSDLWVGRQKGGLTRLRYRDGVISTKTYTQSDGLPQNTVYAVYRSNDGSIWAATLNAGVGVLRNDHFTTYSRANGMSSDSVSAMAESPDGTMWFATPNGLNVLSNGQWRVFPAHDGMPSDNVNCLLPDSAGTLWIGTASGLAFMNGGHIQLPSDAPEPLHESILGLAEDSQGRLWIATSNHILSVKRNRLPGGEFNPADVREYGLEDGLQGTEGVKRQPSVLADNFGRVWFSTNRGLSVINTGRADSSVPEIVAVEGLSVDGNPMNLQQPVRMSPGGHRVTFTYSGLSLSVPERVRFKYKLEGFDQGWSGPTAAREAVYTNLGPGSYRFRVVASNGDGVWNGVETAVPFEVAPAYWQTWWFRLCCVLVGALLVLTFYRLRVRRVTNQMRLRYEERLAERTRIAQELHDTLLQGMISASMQLHVVAEQIAPDSSAKPTLNRILSLMERVTEEGRSAVGGLRSLQNSSLDLGRAFSEIRQQFDPQNEIAFQVIAEGTPRPLHPIIRDEIYSIGREALTNAFRHAHASSMEVELEYAADGLRVLVRDNGHGFDSEVLRFGRDGHWGLSGMHERAKRINAKLRVLSRPSAGTEVELSVPSRVVFIPQPANATSNWWSKIRPHGKQGMGSSSSDQGQ